MPSSDQLNRRDWEVRDASMMDGRRLVEANHYARGASNTRTYLHGLFPRWADNAEPVGVAWWIPPTKSAAKNVAGEGWRGVLALSRLVCEPDVPRNGASFLIAKSISLIDRARWPVLLTYADDWQGHSGGIYRATGWREDGRTAPEPTYQIEGRMVSRKAGPKTRTHADMLNLGATMVGRFSKIRFVKP